MTTHEPTPKARQTGRETLEVLYERLFGDPPHWDTDARSARFILMLDAGAYESAALMLVPPNLDYEMHSRYARLVNLLDGRQKYEGWGKTPALALCDAIDAAIARPA